MSYKSCENCIRRPDVCRGYFADDCIEYDFRMLGKIPCPKCGGILSETREHAGKKFRYCYACHFEFEEETQ